MVEIAEIRVNGLNFPGRVAFLLSFLFFLIAALRPVEMNHDTGLYIEQVEAYFVDGDIRFPDLLFDGLAKLISLIVASFSPSNAVAGRFFLVIIAMFQGALLFAILRRKRSAVEAVLIAFAFGPLIFMDIIRQGTAMLLAGVFFSGKNRQYLLLLGALATHVVSIVALLALPATRRNIWIITILLSFTMLIVVFVLQDELASRYEYYIRTVGYLHDKENFTLTKVMDMFSTFNFIVLLFFFLGYKIGSFTLQESALLGALYLLSIYIPLLYRLYLFFFFCVACSGDRIKDGKQLSGFLSLKQTIGVIFNICYAIVLLRFSIGAFVCFDPN